ncbi:MAG: PEP-CTERM sorting domain-containing protein [Chromatiaceae bacterium]|nr:PEP-CTERM sorting domain-containing protein [Chromatiaceae bacterium]
MLKKFKTITAALAMGVCGNALAYNVDGKLDDWLGANAPSSASYSGSTKSWITNPYLRFEPTTDGNQMAADGSNSSWKPVVDAVYVEEDGYTSNKGDGLNGGPIYDAAAMYSAVSGDKLYLAIVTGTPEHLGVSGCSGYTSGCWDPGDIGIYVGDHEFVFGTDQYQFGVETTGRIGHLDYSSPQPSPQQTFAKGTLVKDPVWAHGLPGTDGTEKTAMLNGTAVGTVALSYDNNSKFWKPDWCSEVMGCNPAKWDVSPDDGWQAYYVIEAAIPLAMIGISTSSNPFYYYALSWTQNCGNDAIRLTGRDPGRSVPEPGALAVMMIGLVGLGVSRRRKQVARG